MSDAALSFADATEALNNALKRGGRYDAPCPVCGPMRKGDAAGRRVLALYRHVDRRDPDGLAIGYQCVRCGIKGLATDDGIVPKTDLAARERARRNADNDAAAEERRKAANIAAARLIWRRAEPVEGTPAERYLRQLRGYAGALPTTLRYLAAGNDRDHPDHAALIGAAGAAIETDDDLSIDDEAVEGLIRVYLNANGSKAAIGKKSIGAIKGNPVWLNPVNDGLSIAICEGIEDALSFAVSLGIGAMAVGGAGFFGAAAIKVPRYVEAVLLAEDGNDAGRMGCDAIERELRRRTDWLSTRPPDIRRVRTWEGSP